MPVLILIRFHSQYSDFVKEMLNEENITDYVFSSEITFAEETNLKQASLKSWPEAHCFIIKALEPDKADKLIEKVRKYKEEKKITNKIKIFSVPILNYA